MVMSIESGKSTTTLLSDDALEYIITLQEARQTAVVIAYLVQRLMENHRDGVQVNFGTVIKDLVSTLDNLAWAVQRPWHPRLHGLLGANDSTIDRHVESSREIMNSMDMPTVALLYERSWDRLKAELDLLEDPENALPLTRE